MAALIFAFFNVVFGAMQGIIVWLFAEYVPPKHQEWIDAALHKGGVLLYSILVGAVTIYQILLLHLLPWEWERWALVLGLTATKAFLTRALLFDPSLNLARNWYTHREKKSPMIWTPWAVGGSAKSDRLVVHLAFLLNKSPESTRFWCWLLTWGVAIFFFFSL